jgi:spermidine/putrescine transport system permease protein
MMMTVNNSSFPVPPANRPLWRLVANRDWTIPAFLVVWFALVVAPLVVLFAFSFFDTKSYVTIYEPSLNTWISLLESGRLGVTLRTLRIALTVTLIDLVIAFPFALWLAKGNASKSTRAIVVALLTIPFFLDISSRTIIWRAILGENGAINSLLMNVGLIGAPLNWMLYTEWSVHFGLVIASFPTMVLPIYLAISIIDDALIQASGDLGASPAQTLFRVIVPLALPGVTAGILLTLGSALAAWIEPSMLGGGFVNLLSNSVESAFTALRYPVVAALSTFVIVLLVALLFMLLLLTRRFGDVLSTFRVLKN